MKLNLQTYSTLLKVAHNKARLNHLLNLFDLSTEELCEKISQERVNPITPDELLQEEIKVSYLKKIDKVFNQGIYYYLDPSSPSRSKTASVFFRKKTFHTTPNLETRRRVMEFEGLKHSLAAIEKLSEQKTKRHLPIHSVDEDAAKIGKKLQEELVARVPSKKREYLKTLITALSSLNIYVFEFVETWNKNERANIDGFYIRPNLIVLKRNQKAMSRELFTLAHELGHYLLDIEEIEAVEMLYNKASVDKVEQWCNEFAFHFLAGNWAAKLEGLPDYSKDPEQIKQMVTQMAKATHLSQLAIYTRLLILKKISFPQYKAIQKKVEGFMAEKARKEKLEKELAKAEGRKMQGRAPKPILSPRYLETLRTAYFKGVLEESEFVNRLKIKSSDINKYLV